MNSAQNTIDPNVVEPNAIQPSGIDPNAIDPSTIDPSAIDPSTLAPNAIDPSTITPESFATHLPSDPSIWPLAWGWWALLALIILCILVTVFISIQTRKKHQAKRTALTLIKNLQKNDSTQKEMVARAHEIHRQVCLSYYPRYLLAELHTHYWYAFLDDQNTTSPAVFQNNQQQWQDVLYKDVEIDAETADRLIKDTKQWIGKVLPPSKKQIAKVSSLISRLDTNNLDDDI